MKALITLAERIAEYNLLGRRNLPPIKLAIIHNPEHVHTTKLILNELDAIQIDSFAKVLGIGGYQCFRSNKVRNMEIILFQDIFGQGALEDQQFFKRRKVLQTLRTNPEIFFLYLDTNSTVKISLSDRSEILSLKRLDPSVGRQVQWKNSTAVLYRDLMVRWQSANRFNIIYCLQDIKQLLKDLTSDEVRESKWLQMKSDSSDPLSFAFQLNYVSKAYLVSSFEGQYSSESVHFPDKYSIHWEIMDLLEDLWKEQGAQLKVALERMPLSHIQEELKMYDSNSIGGFLPASCFLRIFGPLLEDFAQAIDMCLQLAKYKIIQHVQAGFEYYYARTNIRQSLVELEISEVETICDDFLKQARNSIQAQISYVYAPADSFWEMRNLKTSLYSPEQQTNIEVKYIGKIYLQRVYQSVSEAIPRLIGQSLLRKISNHISQQSMHHLLAIIKDTPLQIMITEQQKETLRNKQVKKQQCRKLIGFYSLKVHSTYLLKNIHNKLDRQWKGMFQHQARENEEKENHKKQVRRQGGFLNWMKKIFKTSDQSERQKPKRTRSIDKEDQQPVRSSIVREQPQEKLAQATISDKAWILLLHNNKKTDQGKLSIAASEGFPIRLRPSIWFWLATRDDSRSQSKCSRLLERQSVDFETEHQINKDLGRTPPSQLFKKKYRNTLKRVLMAYSLTDKEISYTQGMNFIAAVIICTLIHHGAEEQYLRQTSQQKNPQILEQKTFTIFSYVMDKTGFRRLMLIERAHIAQICFKLDEKIKILSPSVHERIIQSGFTSQLIFGPLFMTGLVGWSNQLQVKQRVMDFILVRGVEHMYEVAAGVTALSSEFIQKVQNEMVYDFLRNKALDVFFDKAGHQGLTELFNSF